MYTYLSQHRITTLPHWIYPTTPRTLHVNLFISPLSHPLFQMPPLPAPSTSSISILPFSPSFTTPSSFPLLLSEPLNPSTLPTILVEFSIRINTVREIQTLPHPPILSAQRYRVGGGWKINTPRFPIPPKTFARGNSKHPQQEKNSFPHGLHLSCVKIFVKYSLE